MSAGGLEAAFNEELARRLAANAGTSVDRLSKLFPGVRLSLEWDADSAKCVVTASHGEPEARSVSDKIGIRASAADVDAFILKLAAQVERMRLRAHPTTVDSTDDDIPYR